jgi:hypothetical protein
MQTFEKYHKYWSLLFSLLYKYLVTNWVIELFVEQLSHVLFMLPSACAYTIKLYSTCIDTYNFICMYWTTY